MVIWSKIKIANLFNMSRDDIVSEINKIVNIIVKNNDNNEIPLICDYVDDDFIL